MKKSRRSIRIEAAHAAAVTFSSGNYSTVEELWSLCVFYEKFIRKGGQATLKEFGPHVETATVIKLVQPQ